MVSIDDRITEFLERIKETGMSYSKLPTPGLSETAIVAFHRLSARCPGDANAAVLERCIHELVARATELDSLKSEGKWTARERALHRNDEIGVELTRG